MFFLLLMLLILALAVYITQRRKRRNLPRPFVPEVPPSDFSNVPVPDRTLRRDDTLEALLSQVVQGQATTDLTLAMVERLAAPRVAAVVNAQPTIIVVAPPALSTRSQPALRHTRYLLDGEDGYRTPTDRMATLSAQMRGRGLCSPRSRT